MRSNSEIAADLVRLVQKIYPDWTGFTDPRFERHEGEYKRKAVEFLQERLSKDKFDELLASEQFDEIIDRLWQIGQKTNLLFKSVPREGDLSILAVEDQDKTAFCQALSGLLYGSEDITERIDQYVGFVDANGLPNKWAFLTYFLYLAHPDVEIFIKPEGAKWFLKLAGSDLKLGSSANSTAYLDYKSAVTALRAGLPEQFTPRDMIDLQGMIWVARAAAKKETQGGTTSQSSAGNIWKIAPGENARRWDEWTEQDIVSVG